MVMAAVPVQVVMVLPAEATGGGLTVTVTNAAGVDSQATLFCVEIVILRYSVVAANPDGTS